MVPTGTYVGSIRAPPIISVTQLRSANLFIKIRQLYQFLSPVRLQTFVSESTLLWIVLFHSKLSRSVILGNMFSVLTIVTSRRCSDYLNHALKKLVALIYHVWATKWDIYFASGNHILEILKGFRLFTRVY